MKFETATDFRKSLEARLKHKARNDRIDLQRLRRQVAFDRLLARIFKFGDSSFILKGGYAMELRFSSARATKDLDLTTLLRANSTYSSLAAQVHSSLVAQARIDLGDYFVYEIARPNMELENAPYGGARFPVRTTVDNRLFVQFHLDVGADVVSKQTEQVVGEDWLGYCGIEPPQISMISIEQQLAEKLHAYTRPRSMGLNTRVKDLVDMLLLCRTRTVDVSSFRKSLRAVFRARNSHTVPDELPEPPESWAAPFSALARDCGVNLDLADAYTAVERFFSAARL